MSYAEEATVPYVRRIRICHEEEATVHVHSSVALFLYGANTSINNGVISLFIMVFRTPLLKMYE
jgi:hypothetical protein